MLARTSSPPTSPCCPRSSTAPTRWACRRLDCGSPPSGRDLATSVLQNLASRRHELNLLLTLQFVTGLRHFRPDSPAPALLQVQLPAALTCNPLTTNISGTPILSPVSYVLATQPAGPPDTIPSCGSGTAYPTTLAAESPPSGGLCFSAQAC